MRTPPQSATRRKFGLISGCGRNQRIDHRFHFAFLRGVQGQQRPAHGTAIVAAIIHGAFHAGDAELPHELLGRRQDATVKLAGVGRLPRGDGLIQFNFKLSGDMSLAVSRTEPLRWNRPSLLVWAQPRGIDISEWTAPSARERFIIISIRPEFLSEHFLTSSVDAPPQLQAFIADKREKITYLHRPLSSQTFDVTTRLLNNPFSGALALVYTEALALELLCSAVQSFTDSSGPPYEEYTERELKCLHMARNMLMRKFAPPPTITNLARSVGMAKSTLTKGFKAVFGETILDYSLGCRMRHALALMRDQSWSVAKASEAVGYAHPTSFTTAFRRHFGMRPIDVRRVKSRQKTS